MKKSTKVYVLYTYCYRVVYIGTSLRELGELCAAFTVRLCDCATVRLCSCADDTIIYAYNAQR